MDEINNTVELCGTAAGAPVFSHGGRGENFYTFPLEVLRLSGTGDTVNVVVRERLLDQMPVDSAGRPCAGSCAPSITAAAGAADW